MHQQQPLAFTLIKTVVTARDEGRRLSLPLQTAWELLRAEMSPAHRVISDEVAWGPEHQNDLKFVIDGLRTQFEKDPSLEKEVLTFLAEVEPYEENKRGEAALPLLLTTSVAGNTSLSLFQEEEFIPSQSENPGNIEMPLDDQSKTLQIDNDLDNSDWVNNEEDSQLDNVSPSNQAEDVNLQADTAREDVNQTTSAVTSTIPSTPSLESAASPQLSSHPNYFVWGSLIVIALMLVLAYAVWPEKTVPSPSIIEKAESTSSDTLADSIQKTRVEIQPLTSEVSDFPASRIPYESPTMETVAQIVDSLLAKGLYAEALQKQGFLTEKLVLNGANAEVQAGAQSLLAQLYSSQNNTLQAVIEQRKALDNFYQAYGDDSIQAGRAHLTLGIYYSQTDQLLMSNAHLRQARKIFGQHQSLTKPSDLNRAAALGQEILNRS